jgi:hypothetical protein
MFDYCPICLAENEKSIKERGYGRSYIPSYLNCKDHPYPQNMNLLEINKNKSMRNINNKKDK